VELGGVPRIIATDRLTAAVNNIGDANGSRNVTAPCGPMA